MDVNTDNLSYYKVEGVEKSRVKTLGTNILLEELGGFQEKTTGGLIIPTSGNDNQFSLIARVLAVGDEVKFTKIGDIIVTDKRRVVTFRWYSDLHVIEERLVMGIIEFIDKDGKPVQGDIGDSKVTAEVEAMKKTLESGAY